MIPRRIEKRKMLAHFLFGRMVIVWVCIWCIVRNALLSICFNQRESKTDILVLLIRIDKFLWVLKIFACSSVLKIFNSIHSSSSSFREQTWKKYLTHLTLYDYFVFFSFNLFDYILYPKWLQMKSPKYTYNNLKLVHFLLLLLVFVFR